jgi:hypothetical protein
MWNAASASYSKHDSTSSASSSVTRSWLSENPLALLKNAARRGEDATLVSMFRFVGVSFILFPLLLLNV